MSKILLNYSVDKTLEEVTQLPSFDRFVQKLKNARTVVFIGNGGILAVAQHMASDTSRHLNKFCYAPDAAHLTALGKDTNWIENWINQTLMVNGVNIDLIVGYTTRTNSPIYKTLKKHSEKTQLIVMDSGDQDDIILKVQHLHLFESIAMLVTYAGVQAVNPNFIYD